ncbi:MAG: hypothetical protein NTY11_02445, partial [Candidatus Parcubacteria bacterium]|nr:hypothetical protein [Candidatus Parcubacteria bacterium]
FSTAKAPKGAFAVEPGLRRRREMDYAAGARNFRKTSEATPDKGNLATSPGRVIFGGKFSTGKWP